MEALAYQNAPEVSMADQPRKEPTWPMEPEAGEQIDLFFSPDEVGAWRNRLGPMNHYLRDDGRVVLPATVDRAAFDIHYAHAQCLMKMIPVEAFEQDADPMGDHSGIPRDQLAAMLEHDIKKSIGRSWLIRTWLKAKDSWRFLVRKFCYWRDRRHYAKRPKGPLQRPEFEAWLSRHRKIEEQNRRLIERTRL
jgi:hypothetical protein